MSIRPTVTGVSIAKMQSVLGSKDELVNGEWCERFSRALGDKPQQATIAAQIIGYLIDTPRDLQEMNSESEHIVIAFDQLAKMCESVPRSESLFFETICANVTAERSRIDWFSIYRHRFLIGRPLLGECFNSNWSYYTYLLNDELQEFALRCRDDERIACYYDAPAAFEWMQQVADAKLDAWIFFS